MKNLNQIDRIAVSWFVFITLIAIALLWLVGVDGLVNHGDTAFPLHASLRFIDGVWAWKSRLNFGVPQYLAHSTLPFDLIRAVPDVLGIPVIVQSQAYFIATIMVVGFVAERFATIGLHLRHPLARIVTASVLVFNPFNVSQLLGGQGVQLIQYAALVAALIACLQFGRTDNRVYVLWFALATMFINAVFFPFLIIIVPAAVLAQKRIVWTHFIWLGAVAIVANLFWMVPLVARAITAPVIGEIFQHNTAQLVLNFTGTSTSLIWVLRVAYAHYSIYSPYSLMLKGVIGVCIGLVPVIVAVILRLKTRNRLIMVFSIVWLIGVILATGIRYPIFKSIYEWLFVHLPFFQAYRVPTKFLIVVMIGYSAVLGLGLDALFESKTARSTKWLYGIVGVVLVCILITGGLAHGRSLARLIGLAHYPSDYYRSDYPKSTRWLEVLPIATLGGYVPTQDVPLTIIRTYTPSTAPFDQSIQQAIQQGTVNQYLASLGIQGWLLHSDIPGTEPFIDQAWLTRPSHAITLVSTNINPAPLVSVVNDLRNVSSTKDSADKNITDYQGPKSALTVVNYNPVSYQVANVPKMGTLILRMNDDPWWEAADSNGVVLQKTGKAYNLFPAWELNGSDTVTIRFVGQRYFLIGLGLSAIGWIGMLWLVFRKKIASA